MRKKARHAISQLLYLQMIKLIVNSEYALCILSLHTAVLCYKNRWIIVYTPLVNILLRRTLSVTPLRNLPVNKILRQFG